jgi:hypothetical protein
MDFRRKGWNRPPIGKTVITGNVTAGLPVFAFFSFDAESPDAHSADSLVSQTPPR